MSYWQALQIYPIGLAIAGALWVVVYKFVLRPLWLAWAAKPWRGSVIGTLALILLILPYADEFWIAWQFSKLCEDAGVHVTRKVEVDGYYDATTTGWSKAEIVTDKQLVAEYEKAGFRFRERNTSVSGSAPGKISHLEKYPDGTWRITVLDHPTARYHYRFADPRQEVPVGLKLEKTEDIVVDSQTGEVIARDIHYTRYLGWVESLWVRFFGSGAVTCKGTAPKPPELRYLLYHYVLVPASPR
jgi:hypothetical protein